MLWEWKTLERLRSFFFFLWLKCHRLVVCHALWHTPFLSVIRLALIWGISMFLILFFCSITFFNRLTNFQFLCFWLVGYCGFQSLNHVCHFYFCSCWYADIWGPSHVCENAFNVEFPSTYRRWRQWNCSYISVWGQ